MSSRSYRVTAFPRTGNPPRARGGTNVYAVNAVNAERPGFDLDSLNGEVRGKYAVTTRKGWVDD